MSNTATGNLLEGARVAVPALGQGLRHVIDAGFGSRDPQLLNAALGAVVAVAILVAVVLEELVTRPLHLQVKVIMVEPLVQAAKVVGVVVEPQQLDKILQVHQQQEMVVQEHIIL